MGGWVGDITCIFFVPMSPIDDSWLTLVPRPVARGRLGYPEGTALRRRSDWLRAPDVVHA